MRGEIAMSVFHKRKKCRLQSSTASNSSMRQLEQTIDRLTSFLGDTNKTFFKFNQAHQRQINSAMLQIRIPFFFSRTRKLRIGILENYVENK
jgi:hypothetical protein